jgi:hypothetical protein
MALQKGDRLKLQFAASQYTWMRAWQISIIESNLESNESFTLISADYWQEYHVIFTIEIINPLTAANDILDSQKIIKLILAANPWGYALVFEKEIIAPAVAKVGEIAEAAAPWVGMTGVIIIFVLILLIKK